MSKTDEYRRLLAESTDPEAFALEHPGLPGPRGNLELIAVLAESTDEPALWRWAAMDPDEAPGNEPPVVLAVAGLVGLGILLARGRDDVLPELHRAAADPRWRVREGVAMALQRLGAADGQGLLRVARMWSADPDPLVQRAVVAALCEPANLRDPDVAAAVVEVLGAITASLRARTSRRDDAVRVLRQALGYGWSVAIVAAPAAGTAAFDRLAADDDPDIRWIVRENLGKSRLVALDPDWVARLRATPGS